MIDFFCPRLQAAAHVLPGDVRSGADDMTGPRDDQFFRPDRI